MKCISDVVRIGSIIIYQLSSDEKPSSSYLCGAIFLVKLQGKFEIDNSWEPETGLDMN